MAPAITLRTVTSGGSLNRPLPDYASLDLSPVFCEPGVVTFEYPRNGKNFDLLKEDVELAILIDGVEAESLRCIIEEVDGDDQSESEDSALWRFNCRTLLGLFDRAIVYPKNWPATTPAVHDFVGATPGEMAITLMTRCQGRGTLTSIDWDFTATRDSAGQLWPEYSLTYDVGIKYSEVIKNWVDLGIVEVRMQGRTLQMYLVDTLGVDQTIINPLRFQGGRDIEESPRKISTRELATFVLVGGTGKYIERGSVSSIIDQWGRRESFHSLEDAPTLGTLHWVGEWVIQTRNKPVLQVTHGLIFEDPKNPVPIQNFDVGDWGLSDVGRGWEKYRVKQWVMSVANDGKVSGSVTLNDLIQERILKLNDRINSISNGTSAAGSEERKDDGKSPAVPGGVDLGTDFYVLDGNPRAILTASWAPVTTNTDGSPIEDLDGYRVRWRYQGEVLWRPTVTYDSNVTSAIFDNVQVNKVVQLQVSAFDDWNRDSGWSSSATILTAHDNVAPEKPAPPVVTSEVGTLRIAWSGLDYLGDEQVADYVGVEVHIGTAPDFVPSSATLKDFLRARSTTATTITDLAYGVDYYARLVAVDSSNNRSDPSESNSTSHAILTELVVTIGDGQVGLAQTQFSDVGNLVDDGSFENPLVRTRRDTAFTSHMSWDNTTSNTGTWSFKINGVSPWTTEDLSLQREIPVKPGERIFGAAAYKVSANLSPNSSVRLVLRWYDKDRNILLADGSPGSFESGFYTLADNQNVVPLNNTWQHRVSAGAWVAPTGATTFDVGIRASTHLAGSVWMDSIEIRKQVGTLLIETAAITNALIADLAVNNAKIANMSVGKLTAGTLSADVTVSSRIKTSDTGARVELNSTGLQAWSAGGTQTVNISAADGSATFVGQIKSGTTGRRIEVNSSLQPEIRFYPTSGANYAKLVALSPTSSGVAVALSSGSYTNNNLSTVGRLHLAADPSNAIKLGQEDVDGYPNGSELWLGNLGASLRFQYGYDTLPRSHLLLDSVGATLAQIDPYTSANSCRFELRGGYTNYYGKWDNFAYALSNQGIFTGTVSTTAATSFTISYGPTMDSTLVPVVTCLASNFGTGTPTVWGLKSHSTTNFTVAWNNSQGMRFNFWCFRI